MQSEEAIKQTIYGDHEKVTTGIRYSTFILVSFALIFALMAVALVYVWSHTHMTELEYHVAREISIREKLLDDQRKLKVEQATLKSSQRIEAIAKDKLGMSYPEREQVIILK
jgi:cell division protein FtsL